jgi:hypothetical protein
MSFGNVMNEKIFSVRFSGDSLVSFFLLSLLLSQIEKHLGLSEQRVNQKRNGIFFDQFQAF